MENSTQRLGIRQEDERICWQEAQDMWGNLPASMPTEKAAKRRWDFYMLLVACFVSHDATSRARTQETRAWWLDEEKENTPTKELVIVFWPSTITETADAADDVIAATYLAEKKGLKVRCTYGTYRQKGQTWARSDVDLWKTVGPNAESVLFVCGANTEAVVRLRLQLGRMADSGKKVFLIPAPEGKPPLPSYIREDRGKLSAFPITGNWKKTPGFKDLLQWAPRTWTPKQLEETEVRFGSKVMFKLHDYEGTGLLPPDDVLETLQANGKFKPPHALDLAGFKLKEVPLGSLDYWRGVNWLWWEMRDRIKAYHKSGAVQAQVEDFWGKDWELQTRLLSDSTGYWDAHDCYIYTLAQGGPTRPSRKWWYGRPGWLTPRDMWGRPTDRRSNWKPLTGLARRGYEDLVDSPPTNWVQTTPWADEHVSAEVGGYQEEDVEKEWEKETPTNDVEEAKGPATTRCYSLRALIEERRSRWMSELRDEIHSLRHLERQIVERRTQEAISRWHGKQKPGWLKFSLARLQAREELTETYLFTKKRWEPKEWVKDQVTGEVKEGLKRRLERKARHAAWYEALDIHQGFERLTLQATECENMENYEALLKEFADLRLRVTPLMKNYLQETHGRTRWVRYETEEEISEKFFPQLQNAERPEKNFFSAMLEARNTAAGALLKARWQLKNPVAMARAWTLVAALREKPQLGALIGALCQPPSEAKQGARKHTRRMKQVKALLKVVPLIADDLKETVKEVKAHLQATFTKKGTLRVRQKAQS